MRIGIVLSTNDPEEYGALRFANVALDGNLSVKGFLVNKGVETEDIKSETISCTRAASIVRREKRSTVACGTIMKNRQKQESKFCPIATMKICSKSLNGQINW